MGLKFGAGGGMCLDNISDEFIGQGHRSQFKGNVIVSESLILIKFWVTPNFPGLRFDVKTSCDVTAWRHDNIWRHSMMSWRHMTSQCDTTSCRQCLVGDCTQTVLNFTCTKMSLMLPQSSGLWCNPICLLYMCVCQSIMAWGLLGKRAEREGNAGGTRTLRRFHQVQQSHPNLCHVTFFTHWKLYLILIHV